MAQDFTDDCFAGAHTGQEDLQNMEDNFAALKSLFSGASAPANTVAFMPWGDTTNHILKVRNEANNAWINLLNMAGHTLTAGTGLTGGGDLSGNITISINTAGVSQSLLKTSSGSVSLLTSSNSSNSGNLTLPGGEYGFYPQVRVSTSTGHASITIAASYFNTTTYTTNINITGTAGASDLTTYAQQRYVTSSGEVYWIFILRDKESKTIISLWQAPDHPCFGNGGDPVLVSHPFPDFDPRKHEIVVITPDKEEVTRMLGRCSIPGEDTPSRDIIDVIINDYMIIEDSSPLWPEVPVTVGLPKNHDWKRMMNGSIVGPIKKQIPKSLVLTAKSMRLK